MKKKQHDDITFINTPEGFLSRSIKDLRNKLGIDKPRLSILAGKLSQRMAKNSSGGPSSNKGNLMSAFTSDETSISSFFRFLNGLEAMGVEVQFKIKLKNGKEVVTKEYIPFSSDTEETSEQDETIKGDTNE